MDSQPLSVSQETPNKKPVTPPAEQSDIEADRIVSQKLDTEWWDKQAEADYRARWLDDMPEPEER